MYSKGQPHRLTLDSAHYVSQLGNRKISSFLSPLHDYNHRSFSTTSLRRQCRPSPSRLKSFIQPPLHAPEQPDLRCFKKSVEEGSRLNKVGAHRAMKIETPTKLEDMKREEREEIRQLQKELIGLQNEIDGLRRQHHSDLQVIDQQSKLILQLRETVASLQSASYQAKVTANLTDNLHSRIHFMQLEHKQMVSEIRSLVFQIETLKAENSNLKDYQGQAIEKKRTHTKVEPNDIRTKQKKMEPETLLDKYFEQIRRARFQIIDQIDYLLPE